MANDIRLLLGVTTDFGFLSNTSTVSTKSSSKGEATLYDEIGIQEDAFTRELGLHFISGFQFIQAIDIYLGLGGSSTFTSQSIEKERTLYLQKNTFSAALNAKGSLHFHANIGLYAFTGIGIEYIILRSAGGYNGKRIIDLGIRWHDVSMYFLFGTGSSLFASNKKNHRFSLGIQGKYILQNNKPYAINDSRAIKDFTFGVANFLIGLNFEYAYIF